MRCVWLHGVRRECSLPHWFTWLIVIWEKFPSLYVCGQSLSVYTGCRWATLFYCCLCCLNSFPCNTGNFLVLTKQYTKPQMTLNTHHQNMTFKAFLDFSIKWQYPGGLFRGRPATTLLWILQFECQEDVTPINVSIFVYLWGAAYISLLKYSQELSVICLRYDTDDWTSKSNQFIIGSKWVIDVVYLHK